jgi:hypothetical protein
MEMDWWSRWETSGSAGSSAQVSVVIKWKSSGSVQDQVEHQKCRIKEHQEVQDSGTSGSRIIRFTVPMDHQDWRSAGSSGQGGSAGLIRIKWKCRIIRSEHQERRIVRTTGANGLIRTAELDSGNIRKCRIMDLVEVQGLDRGIIISMRNSGSAGSSGLTGANGSMNIRKCRTGRNIRKCWIKWKTSGSSGSAGLWD